MITNSAGIAEWQLRQHGKPLAGGRNQYYLVAISEFAKSTGLIYQLYGRHAQRVLEFDERG